MVCNYEIYEEVPKEVKERVRKAVTKLGYKLKIISKYSNHPADGYLYLVIAQGGHDNSYTVWLYNSETSAGLCEGHYNLTFKDAMLIFANKLKDIYK